MKPHLYNPNIKYLPQIVANPDEVQFLVIDLFCGAGGTSTGFLQANGKALVIACINHDAKAIESHWLNHPEVLHFEEDIRTVELSPLVSLLNQYKAIYPNAKVILWASLECTNFSKAKGGQARDADSRTLAEHLDRYVIALDPDYIQIENVVEFMSWGPLDEKGKPVSRKSGSDYLKWCKHIDSFGYRNEWKEMNSADFGAYTSRNRLFGCFAKDGLPIAWPESTHAKKPVDNGMFGNVKKWKAVKDVLDLEDEGISIFNRKKPLVDASLERIEAGLIKFVAGGKEAFLLQYNSGSVENRALDIDNPCNTIPTENRFALASTHFIAKYYSGKPAGKVISVNGPAGTIRTSDGQSVINCKPFISQRNSGNPGSKIVSVDNPARTLTATGGNQELVLPFIMNTNFKNGPGSVNEPAKTLLASRHHPYVVNPCFLTQYYSSGGQLASINEPGRTLGTRDTIAKVQTLFIQREYKTATNTSIYEPLGAIPTVPKANLVKSFILNPSHGGHTTGTDVPCVVIVARQDKAPLYLVQFKQHSGVAVPIYEGDSKVMIRIKEFMALYGLSDIKMRMLKVSELLPIQGFPKNYVLAGNQTDQKKFIGNSVVPQVVTAWCLAMADRINEIKKVA
ncbi:DNA cytosine methyltransferase [Pedobacter agri]|uniref:DNA (cytosine-5-)-methyltransferase n=1 Tax=Pedobacter agri TaxID=454586 RepID=A0A9X3IB07_9SPHI|nr:DNA cytosine methyltransferase [Pedobacter agri]MCX3266579.1 DNA cytosine methyltransferase [Pedobacter agri]